ncbi:hypothetical protein BGZ58_001962 [Dissophora ornata]|nr:hypothetical protein BGZ58_001962 [Dissophora ornata]
MTDNPYPVGTTVFAKLKGYPWWPARIESDEDLPANVSNKKPKQRPIWPVFFFGSYDYGWFGTSELKSFDPTSAEKAKTALKKGSGLRTALSEALDPSLIAHRTAANQGQDEDEDEDEDELDQEPVVPAAKKKAATKAKKATPKSEQTPAEKKRRPSTTEDQPAKRKAPKKASVEEEDEDEPPKAKKRAGTISRSRLESDFKSVDDDISISDTHNGGTKRSEDDVGDSADVRAKKKIRSGQPSERLLKLRHKLQKLLLVEGLSDEVLVQNLDRADPILAEVEAFEIDLQMLKDTKIGRLMKKISNLQFSRDQHKIVERSVKLIKQYKVLMEEALENGGDHHTSTQIVKNTVEALAAPAVESLSVVSTITNTAQTQSSSVSGVEKTTSETIRVGETVSATAPLANSNKHVPDRSAPTPEAVVAAVAAIVETSTLSTNTTDTTTAPSSTEPIQAQEAITAVGTEHATV